MEVKDIDFSTKPKAYKLCFNDNCSFVEKCLRHIAVAKLEECSDLLQVVNHAIKIANTLLIARKSALHTA